MNNPYPLEDTHQNFWQLASIQTASMGFPGIAFGWYLSKQFGPGNAIGSICLGSLLLWLIGIVIISMTSRDRSNAIENTRKLIGRNSAILVALFLACAFLGWYILQLKSSVFVIDNLFQLKNKSDSMILGGILGGIGALLAMGGIRLIKWMNVICLPLLIGYHVYALSTSSVRINFSGGIGLSLYAIINVMFFLLPGIVFLPTFFRHSRSRADSGLALTLMIVIFSFFEISSVWIGFDNSFPSTFIDFSSLFIKIVFLFLISLISFSSYVVNIYFASGSWETISFYFNRKKSNLIIGLLGTMAYLFIQTSSKLHILYNLSNYYISCLGIALTVTFLAQFVIKDKAKVFGKLTGSSAWLAGCLGATIFEIRNPNEMLQNLLGGMGITIFFFLSVVFLKTTLWAIKTLIKA